MYKIEIVSLENCPFSEAAESLAITIKPKVIKVEDNSTKKINYKKIYPTFPQVYLINEKSRYLLGGYTEFKKINDLIMNRSENLDTIINELKFLKLSRKNKLRLINLFLVNIK